MHSLLYSICFIVPTFKFYIDLEATSNFSHFYDKSMYDYSSYIIYDAISRVIAADLIFKFFSRRSAFDHYDKLNHVCSCKLR